MKKFLLTLTLFIAVAITAGAQTAKGVIQGTLIDAKSKEPIEFASVALIPQGTTAPVNGCNTEENGTFILTGVKAGTYTLQFSFVGYMTDSRKVTVANNGKVNIGKVALKQDKKLLKEIVVSEQRSQMSFEIDKRVFTVDQSIASTGGSVTDVLTDIPSVEVSNEGSVSLRGSESVTVWINGKASGLTADNQGDILQQMPAESIEKIEVITNPSAKHSPEGTAGIINIVLKRNRKAGHYGSVQAGANSLGGYNASGNINYSSGKLDAYASLNYRNNRRENGSKTYTQYLNRDSYQLQTGDGERNHNNLFARAGLTWHPTANDDIYTNLTGMFGGGDNKNTIISDNGTLSLMDVTTRRTRITDGENKPRMYNVEAGYTHRFATDHYIDISLSHNIWNMENKTSYDQTIENTVSSATSNSYQFQRNKMNNTSTEIKLDYENKLSENSRIEAGYSGRFSDDESPVYTYTDKAHSIIDEQLFNRFIYKQNTHALYGTYSGRIDKFGYQIGLRGEYWETKTRSLDWAQENSGTAPAYTKKDFFALFPSLFLTYSLNGGHEFQVNYTRRLRRPWGGQLNSFSNITDSTNISFGNPGLTPEYSNAYELNYIKNWKNHTLSLSGYYRTTEDVIERISYNVGNIIYTTSENVASSNSAGLEIIGKNRLWKKFDLTTTVNLFYYKLDGFNYTINNQTITGKADENFSWNARMTGSLILPWAITMQMTGRYDARRIVAQGHRKASYSFDLGLRKSFNEHWSMSLSARDLFDSRRWHTITEDANFRRDAENWNGGRTISATLTYSFGNMKAKRPTKKPKQNESMDNYNGYGEEME